jgi:outer membrane lipoprotein-sorting protein
MKMVVYIFCCLLLFVVSACAGQTGADGAGGAVTPERLAAEAEAHYAEYLASSGGQRQAATEKTAAYVQTLPGVRQVTVRGSDSLFVIMEDGGELLLLLGKNRL